MQAKIEKSNVQEIFELSSIQKGMLFHFLKETDDNLYNVQLSFNIEGALDVPTLQQALVTVQTRNEALRSVFSWENVSKPLQIVLKTCPLDFEYLDASGDDPQEAIRLADQYSTRHQHLRFDLTRLPLRIQVIRVDEQTHILNIAYHHILFDGWSNGILLTETLRYYNQLTQKKKTSGDPKTSYKEVYQAFRKIGNGGNDATFWKEYLKEYSITSLFLRHQSGTAGKGPIRTQLFTLPSGGLDVLASRHKITKAAILYAAYGILLHKYVASRDILFGTTVSNRNTAIQGIDKVIGNFINTIPLRLAIPEEATLLDIVQGVHEDMIERNQFNGISYPDIKQLLAIRPADNLYDSVIAIENYPLDEAAIKNNKNFRISLRSVYENTSIPLVITIFLKKELEIEFAYKNNFMTDAGARSLAASFLTVLDEIIRNGDKSIHALTLTPGREEDGLLKEYNNTETGYPEESTVVELFEEQVKLNPDSIAIESGDRIIRYGELKDLSDRIGAYLREEVAVKKGDLVGILLDREEYLVPCILGILKAGAAYVPIDSSYPAGRIATIAGDAGLRALITRGTRLDTHLDAQLAGGHPDATALPALQRLDLDKILDNLLSRPVKGPLPSAGANDLAYVLYTSGSTGKPKGVMIEHRSLLNYIHWAARYYTRGERATFPLYTSISFDLTVTSLFTPLITGNKMVLYGEEEKGLVIRQVFANRDIDIIKLTPSHLRIVRNLEKEEWVPAGEKKKLIVGGEEFPMQLAKDIYHQFQGRVEIYNEYGPTEATVGCMIYKFDPREDLLTVPIGVPVNNSRIYLLDGSLKPVPAGMEGELYIGGDGLARGYLGRDQLTREKFMKDPFAKGGRMYRTGDVGIRCLNGEVLYKGRTDDQVKIKGYRIEPGEIEGWLAAHDQLKEVVVVPREAAGETCLVAYYITGEGGTEVGDLREYLSGKLPAYMVPAYFMRLEQWPLTSNGKLDKQALPDPVITVEVEAFEAPRDRTEDRLAGIWSEVLKLGREQISVTKSFLELGGHSIKIIQMLNKVRKEFNVLVPINEVFAHPDIRSLGAFIREQEKAVYVPIEKAPSKEDYNLSSAQKRLYFLHELDKAATTYNGGAAILLEGPVDRHRVSRAVQKLIARHDVFRTSFHLTNDVLSQKIAEEVNVDIEYGKVEENNVQETIKAFIRPFDLEKAPLLRVALIELAPEKHLLLADVHHIIGDGASQEILIKEFIALYQDEQLPALKLQYKDYVEWQQGEAQRKKITSQKDFWRRQFEQQPAVLELPADYARPPVKSYEGSSLLYEISGQETQQLRLLAEKEGVTLFMLMLSFYAVLLGRLSNREEVVIGTPIAGRHHSDLENLIGMFVNTLALRNYPENNLSFRNFLSRVKSNTLACFEHQDLPYEELIGLLNTDRDTSRNPLFDTMFIYRTHIPEAIFELPGLKAKPFDINRTTTKFDLTLSASEDQGRIVLDFEYAKKLLAEATVARFAGYFNNIVSAVLADPDVMIGRIGLLSEEESNKLIHEFNRTETFYPKDKTIIDLFVQQVQKTPGKVAVRFEDKILTYKELDEKSTNIASWLRECEGVRRGDLVGLMLLRDEYLIPCIFGIVKAGAAYVPIDPGYPLHRIASILDDSKLQVLITKGSYPHTNKLSGVRVVDLDIKGEDTFMHVGSQPLTRPSGNDLAYVIYTSGSTGRPKGVMIEHHSVVNRLLWMQKEYPLTETDVLLQKTPLVFDVSVWELFWWSFTGASLCLLQPAGEKDPDQIVAAIEKQGVTTIHFVPSMLSGFLTALTGTPDPLKLASLRRVFASGEALKANHVHQFGTLIRQNTGADLINLYGPTEATVDVSFHQCQFETDYTSVPIGKPIDNIQLYVLNDSLQVAPLGVPGELCIAGVGLARGYLNNERLTNEKFVGHPFSPGEKLYKTGDLVRLLPDGNIAYLGRIDNQVKIRGFRIEPDEIQVQLSGQEGIADCAVMAKGKDSDQYLVAYYVSKNELDPASLRAYLSDRLPDYMVPAFYVRLDRLPLTQNGKLDRAALPDPERKTGNLLVEASGKVEELLVEIWKEILKLDIVSTTDNFFAVGGDSIKSIQICARMRAAGYQLSPNDIFSNPAIRELSRKATSLTTLADQGPSTGEISLTPIQNWFFEGPVADKHHFNQSVWLHFKDGLSIDQAKTIFKKLQDHHDALRIIFRKEGGLVIQENKGIDFPLSIEEYVLTEDTAPLEKLRTINNTLQSGIDLEKGPLMKLGLFHGKDGSRILIIIHHLVTDGLSWRILFEDIDCLYRQVIAKEPFRLPLKTDSFKSWSSHLSKYAESPSFRKANAYWDATLLKNNDEIRRDFPDGAGFLKDSLTASFQISREKTARLLGDVHIPFHTQINDILMASLLLTINREYGCKTVMLDLEGHGREDIIPGVNITRTVGWFTSIYPVLVEDMDQDQAAMIKRVKDTLRKIPNKGFDYLLGGQPKRRTTAQIRFNYLGQFDSDAEKKSFAIESDEWGDKISLQERLEYDWDLSGIITGGRLELRLTYSKDQYRQETIHSVMDLLEHNLAALIDFCDGYGKIDLTPSDLTYQHLSLAQLEGLQQRYEIEDIYLLSPTQNGILYHSLLDTGSKNYLDQKTVQIKGALNVEAIRQSLNNLTERHDILRTAFLHDADDRPLQILLKQRQIDFAYLDIQAACLLQPKDSVIQTYQEKDKSKKFDLSRDSLLRVTLLQTGKEEYELIWSSHHIAMDGWSAGLLWRDFISFYSTNAYGNPTSLTPLKKYVHYLTWLANRDEEASSKYWIDYLAGLDNPVTLPKKQVVQEGPSSYIQGTSETVLEPELTKRLEKVSAEQGVTVNTLFQAAWGILLDKYNNSGDIVFGSVVSGRPAEIEDIENMVGLFINIIPVRINTRMAAPITEWVRKIQTAALQSERHHYHPLLEIMKLSGWNSDLFDHILVFQNYPIDDELKRLKFENQTTADLVITNLRTFFQQTDYDLVVTVIPGEQVLIKADYNKNVYEEAIIDAALAHLKVIIEQITSSDIKAVAEIECLTEKEKQRLLVEWNDTAVPFPESKTMIDLFVQQVQKTPGNVAVSYEDKVLTYQELDQKSTNIASWLRECEGIRTGDLVGIMLQRDEYLIPWIFGIVKAGGAYVPIDPGYPLHRIQSILDDSKLRVLVTKGSYPHTSKLSGARMVDLDKRGEDIFTYAVGQPFAGPSGSDLAYVIYTSGSTGKPKGVMIEHRSVISRLSWMQREYPVTEADVLLLKTPIVFDVSVWELFGWAIAGASLCLLKPTGEKDPEEIITAIEKNRITTIHFVPSMLGSFLAALTGAFDPRKLASLRRVFASGEALKASQVHQFGRLIHQNTGADLINLYGPTEATVEASFHQCGFEKEYATVPIGKPLDNVKLYVLNDTLQLVPMGVSGELCIGGIGLAKGYLNNEPLTKEKFVGNPFSPGEQLYKTGDLVRLLPDGEIGYLGRIDNQIKLRGFRIEPDEIQVQLSGFEGITDCVVIAKVKEGDLYLVAYYISKNEIEHADLRAYLSERLPEYMVPSFYVALDNLPLTANGKLDRRALPDPVIEGRTDEFEGPRDGTEDRLTGIWSEVLLLNREQISVTKGFLELGGHSLKLIQMVNKVRKEFNVTVSLQEAFAHPDIRSLASFIREQDKSVYTPIEKISPKPYYKLSSGQKRLYFLYEFDKTSLAYNMPKVVRLEGRLDKEKLSHTFSRIISRHASLRTTFEVIGQQPVQKVSSTVNFNIDYFQCEEVDAASFIKKMIRPFDLNKGPLMRAGLIELAAEDHLLFIDMHHIITDGVSQMVLIKDFMAAYSNDELPDLHLQYTDYAEWQQNDRQQETTDRQRKYWMAEYTPAAPVLELPADFGRPSIKSYEGDSLDVELPPTMSEALMKMAAKEGATPFMVILSAYAILLHKLTHQTDIVIGTLVAGRRHPDLENMMGMFVNTIPLRNHPQGDLTFREFLSKVKSNTLAGFDNQDYQYESMIEDLKVERDTSRNPLFDVMFSYQDFDGSELTIPGLKGIPYDNGHTVSKFDLTLTAFQKGEDISFNFEYATRLYKRETIERLVDYFQNIITAITFDENIRILDIDMMTEAEKHRILYQFNATEGEYPRQATLVSLFERQVSLTPEKTAVVYEGTRLTYKELNHWANRLAWRLREQQGVKPDQVVGIMCERSEGMMAGLLGILKSGGAYVPIDPAYPKDRTRYILEDCNAKILLVDKPLPEDFPFNGEIILMDAVGNDAGSNLPPVNKPEDLCYLIYTSGSTGKPKGVMISHYNVVNFMTGMSRRLPVDESACMLAVTSTSFDISVLELFWTLCNGMELVIHPADISLTGLDRYTSPKDLSMDFSLFFFSSYDNQDDGKYDLLLESVKYADAEGFKAVWTPERHFHEFGGLYPNPAVTSSALAMVTKQIKLRSGSVVAPLHDTMRIAEEWSVVDNLSKGRVELSFAPGWNPNDFSLAREKFKDRNKIMFEQIEEVKNLWKGGSIKRVNGFGQEVELRVFPRPLQQELPAWITSGGNEDTFISAGKMGANLLTHFLGQDIEELARKIELYRQARERNGFSAASGKVAVMMHTYIGDDIAEIEKLVEGPFIEYLKSSIGLNRILHEEDGLKEEDISEENKKLFLTNAFRRYYKTASLIGTKSSSSAMVQKLKDIGVDEIACLVDFGVEKNKVLEGLKKLKELKSLFSTKEGIDHSPITMMQSTPSFINLAREGAGSKKFLPSLKVLLLGGESVPLSLIHRLKADIDADIYNMYGPTETTIWSSMNKMEQNSEKVSVGKPILNTQIFILDKALKPVPIGVTGDLYIGGEGLSRGYWNKPDLTKANFIPHPFGKEKKIYKTGDIARWLNDGNIELIGREDHQVKIRGHRIELGEIETRLLGNEKVKDAVVVAKEEKEGGEKYLACYLVSEEKLDFSDIRQRLAAYLPDYMIPGYFVQLDQLPLTPNGKVDRKSLPDPGMRIQEEYQAPSGNIENDLAEIWSQVLKMEKELISVDSNFFELGGHSIRAIQLINAIRDRFSVKVELRHIFEYSSVRKLSGLINQFDIQQVSAIPKADQREYYPTSAAQKRLFYQQLRDKDNLLNNTSTALELNGEVNIGRLQQALQYLVDRHDSLRTSFILLDEGLFQQINKDVAFELETLEGSKYHTVRDAFRNFVRPFDMGMTSLMRCGIFRGDNQENYLFFDIHHIICDGLSFNRLIRDFKDIYHGKEPSPVHLRYVDYCCWLNAAENNLDKQQQFWTRQLSGDLPRLNLSIGNVQDVSHIYPASSFILEINARRCQDIRKFIAGHKASDFMFFLSIYYILLSKMSGNADIIIGSDVAGRTHPSTKDMVGTFVNILPLRVWVQHDKPYGEFLADVKECVLAAFDNQDYQFDEMVSLVTGQEETEQNPIFDVHFAFANTLDSEADMNELQLTPTELYKHHTTQYGFKLEISEKNDTIRIAFIFSSDLYDSATIEVWMQYYDNLISAVLSNDSLDIESIELGDVMCVA